MKNKNSVKDTLAKMAYSQNDLTRKVVTAKKSFAEVQSIINGKGNKKT